MTSYHCYSFLLLCRALPKECVQRKIKKLYQIQLTVDDAQVRGLHKQHRNSERKYVEEEERMCRGQEGDNVAQGRIDYNREQKTQPNI